MNLKKNHYSRRALALLLTLVMCVGMIPTAFAAQQNSYHDPAEHWMQASGRTNELDANSVVTRETFKCGECGKATSFEVFRVPEYTRNGQPALSRNVKYSDGTMVDGVGKGDTMDGIPGKDATYTGYHYTKAVCETCGGINTNMSKSEYGYLKNVYWLYDCAAAFTQELDETVSYEYTDDTYHTVTTKGGTYCAFCYGTNHTVNRKLERHSMVTEVLPQPANGRFATVEKCSLCDYTCYDYTAAKAVVASYYGVVDGQPHTISVTDLSEAGVRTAIRYGNSADSCTMTSAPNYTEEGQYMVYYEITYTCDGVDMTENGVAYVWLRDDTTDENGNCGCGCSNPNCGCQNKHCSGNCCTDKGCGENHKYILLDSTKAGCTTLGYDRYLCTKCGKIEKRDYVDSLGHAWQGIVIRDATCETDGKLLELCSRCGQMKQTATPKGEHSYEVYTVAATCTSPGYTVRECSVCGDRHIEDITSTLPHNYESHVIAATCEGGGKTIHRCDGCGSSFVTDYTSPLGHSWDEGTLITNATCTGEGVMEYRCIRCGYHRIEGNEAAGHVPGNDATCTEPQLCTRCGAVLKNALGHDYKSEVTAPTCTEMGYTTNTCTRCGDSNKSDYIEPTGHKPGDWIIDKEPTTDSEGSKHKECENCGEKLETQPIEKIYNSGTTDSKGEAVVGGYLVTVTDTDTKNPVANAAVTLRKDNSISIRLPNILTNEKYIGDALLQKTYVTDCINKKVKKNRGERTMYYVENSHPAIVSRDLFNQVQQEMTRRSSKRKVLQKSGKTELGKYSGKYALTELLVCGECGSPYKRVTWARNGKKRIVWRCVSRLEFGTKYCQHSPTLDEGRLHSAILAAMNEYAAIRQEVCPDVLTMAEEARQALSQAGARLLQLKKRMDAVSREQSDVLDRLLVNMADTELNARMKALTDEKESLKAQIADAQQAEVDLEEQAARRRQMWDSIMECAAGYTEFDNELVRQVIQKITVEDAETIHIHFRDSDVVLEQEVE